ncbi:MAG: GAF domain-containing protein [Gemmatimonadetes bacterium]|jgi:signal transduction histidine kinase|nr:GAF domain-containing protein [Gemmatimonadota bacterium]
MMRTLLQYTLPALFCLAVFASLQSVVPRLFGEVNGSGWLAALLAIGATAVLTPLWKALARLGDSGKSAIRTDIDRSLNELSQALNLIADLEPLVGEELGKLREAARAERLLLLLAEEEDGPFQLRGQRGCDGIDLQDLQLNHQSRLARWLVTNECPLVIAEKPGVIDFLEPSERDLFAQLQIALVVPLTAMNRLVGLLLIGREQSFERGDLEFLEQLGPRLGLALQNVLLLRQSRLRLRRLYRTERLATVGQLAAGAAHEIRNPLTGIRSTIQYLRRDYGEDNSKRELIDELISEVDRIDQIIAGLLSFARPSDPSLEEVHLPELLRQTIHLVETTARKRGVEISLDLSAEDHSISADPAQLKQVFLNLFMNAIQAMPEGGTLSVAMRPFGDRCQVEVADTGAGMSDEDLERAFDPFFTTKEEGTGLGLAICYGILSRHGGEIDIDSQPGVGTQVKVKL